MSIPNLPSIETSRLSLVLLTEELLSLCLEEDPLRAEKLADFKIPGDWFLEAAFIQRKIDQCRRDPSYVPWCTRAIVLKSANEMIGRIGFHEPPNSAHLRHHGPNVIEFGYTVFPKRRGHGYATEAALGLMTWAARDAGIERFVVSIAPDNVPSQAIARRFGFKKVGEQMDEIDGLEEVFVLDSAALIR